MAVFGGLVMTNNGKKLEAKAQTGKILNFKKIVLGDGELGSSESMINIIDLKHKITEKQIFNIQLLQENIAKVTFILTNIGLTEGFYWRELGIIAEDPDTKEEVLYCYGNARENGEYIPAEGGADILEKHISIDINITNIENVSAIIDESLVFVTKKEFDEIIEDIKNNKADKTEVEQANNELFTYIDDLTEICKVVVTTTETIPENTNYTIPLNYKVGNNSLEVNYMGEKLVKDVHYIEVGEEGSISNIIQFYDWGQDVPIDRTIEFVVRGDYSES